MIAEYRPGRKSGTIILGDLASAPRPWSIAIQRESDQKFYTGTDYRHWLPEENFALMEARALPDSGIAITLAPDLVASLNPRDGYVVWLRTGDGAREQAPLARAGERQGAQPAAQLPVAANPSNRIMRRAIIILLVFACLVWFWLDSRGPEDSLFAPAPLTLDSIAKYPPAEAVKRADELIRGSEKDQADAFALYSHAAASKESSAYLPYAACLDPSLRPCGKAEKNAVEAALYYRQAPDQQAASAAITHMRDWLEQQAQAGNKKAASWLLEF